ncbi:MAG TPA: hypothetical protein VM074_00695 [Solimonas sp.]|nr:hypothetical protein [Solimonas sp.]
MSLLPAVRIVLALLLVGLLPACAVAPEVKAEREALAVFNRCVVAQRDLNKEMQQRCLSQRLREVRATQSGAAAPDSRQRLEAVRDTRPYRTQVQGISVAPDLNAVTLVTQNWSGVLDQKIEHRETIVIVRENGGWVVDRDCCTYADARLLDEEGKPLDKLAPSPQGGDLMPQTEPLEDYSQPEPPQ